jgi:hypothetical protein
MSALGHSLSSLFPFCLHPTYLVPTPSVCTVFSSHCLQAITTFTIHTWHNHIITQSLKGHNLGQPIPFASWVSQANAIQKPPNTANHTTTVHKQTLSSAPQSQTLSLSPSTPSSRTLPPSLSTPQSQTLSLSLYTTKANASLSIYIIKPNAVSLSIPQSQTLSLSTPSQTLEEKKNQNRKTFNPAPGIFPFLSRPS